MQIKTPTAVENQMGMLNQLDKNKVQDKKGKSKNMGAVESLQSEVVRGHESNNSFSMMDRKSNASHVNLEKNNNLNRSTFDLKGQGRGWKPAKWNPEPEFPLKALFFILKGIHTTKVHEAFQQFKINSQSIELSEDLSTHKIEDELVANSMHELSFLETKLEEQKQTLQAIESGIVERKREAKLDKHSDLAKITFLKGMNEIRVIEIEKNMLDFIVYKFNKENWLSELIMGFHITNNTKAMMAFNKTYIDKVFNRAYNIIWKQYFSENADREFTVPKSKIAELEAKCSTLSSNYNTNMREAKDLEATLEDLNKEHQSAIAADKKSKSAFTSQYNKYQALINRTNSKRQAKATTKPAVLREQQTIIDRLAKQLEIGDIKEEELRYNMNAVEDEMLKVNMDLTQRKMTIRELKNNEIKALKTGHKVEVDRLERIQSFLSISCSSEANFRKIIEAKRTTFYKWRTNAISKKKTIHKFGHILLKATSSLYHLRIHMLVKAFDKFASILNKSKVKINQGELDSKNKQQIYELQGKLSKQNTAQYTENWFGVNQMKFIKGENKQKNIKIEFNVFSKMIVENQNRLINFSQNIENLMNSAAKVFYIQDNNLHDHYQKVFNLNNYYKQFNELIEVLKSQRQSHDGPEQYKTLNLSSYLSIKDENELKKNKYILEVAESISKTNPKISKLYKELQNLTQEEDGSLRNKLIMKITADEYNSDQILIPADVTEGFKKLESFKETKKQAINELKKSLETKSKNTSELKAKIAELKNKANGIDRTDFIGLKKKLGKLKKQNEMLKKLKQ